MRCFIPLRADDLDSVAPRAFAAEAQAFADTGDLYAALPDADEEEREFIACLAAADYSALMANAMVPRRIVVALDARVERDGTGDLPCEVRLKEAVTWQDAVALLVDGADAEDAVRRASRSQEDLDALENHDLLWFDITEKDRLAQELSRPAR